MSKMVMVVALLFCATVALGQQQEKMYQIPESQLTEQQKSQFQSRQVTDWVGFGKEVGTAMKEGLSALNDEVNKFSETTAGKFTMFIIAYKVLGKDVLQVTLGFPLWLIGTIYWMFVFWKNCVTRKIVVSEDQRVKTYKVVNDGELAYSRWGHFAAYFLFTIMMALVVLL